MKKALLYLLLCWALSLNAQNWLPIDSAKSYNFTINNGTLIVKTIKAQLSNDTTFFETIIDSCYTCSYNQPIDTVFLQNQADFLGFYMINDFDSVFTFFGRDTFQIKTNKNVGDSWLFNHNTTATVIFKGEKLIGGISDSVISVWLGNTDTLELSKNYGILQIPNLKKNISYHQIGIENTYGAQNLTFWEVYDFNIGDVFQYLNGYGDANINPYGVNTYSKIKVLNKEIKAWGYEYYCEIKNKRSYHTNTMGGYQQVSDFYQYYDTLIFENNDSIFNINTGYWASYFYQNINNTIYLGASYYTDGNNVLTKTYFIPEYLGYFEDYYGFIVCPSYCYLEFLHRKIEYKKGLGKTKDNGAFFEHGFSNELIGYSKEGETFGLVHADEFYVSIKEKTLAENLIQFYPNPVNEYLQIDLQSNQQISISILDLYGKIVLRQDVSLNQKIYIGKLEKGLYIIQACNEENACLQEKILVE
jgi:hypothetical protein